MRAKESSYNYFIARSVCWKRQIVSTDKLWPYFGLSNGRRDHIRYIVVSNGPCYSTGRSDIRDISRVVGIAAVKLHEAKPSAISPLYRKRVEYIPEFHDCPCYNILIPWQLLFCTHPTLLFPLYSIYTTGALYHFFHVGR